MRVLVTRAEPAASRTAALLKEQGHEPVTLPLFEVRDTGIPIPETRFAAAIFTSGNAVDILNQRNWHPPTPMAAYCVGEHTAEKAKRLGFSNVVIGEGGGRKLACKIIEAGFGSEDTLAYFTTPDRSFDLVTHLANHKIHATNIELYQAHRIDPEPETFRQAFLEEGMDAVLCYSQRSAAALAEMIEKAGLQDALTGVTLIAISAMAREPLAAFCWHQTPLPPVANERAMLHILNKE